MKGSIHHEGEAIPPLASYASTLDDMLQELGGFKK